MPSRPDSDDDARHDDRSRPDERHDRQDDHSGGCGHDFHTRRERRERGARIARELADELRRAAEELRIPVANLVRGVVDEALDAAERVTDDLGGLVEDLVGQADRARRGLEARGFGRGWRRHRRSGDGHRARGDERRSEPAGDAPAETAAAGPMQAPPPKAADVLGWVAVTLARDASCTTCWRALPRGAAAHLGVGAGGAAAGPIVCPECREGRYPAG